MHRPDTDLLASGTLVLDEVGASSPTDRLPPIPAGYRRGRIDLDFSGTGDCVDVVRWATRDVKCEYGYSL